MGFAVTVRQFDVPLDVEMGDTILQTALNAGRQYPHGCQSGNCGACKSRLYSGEIEMSPYSEYALTQAEQESGLILACRSVPWSDCEVAYLEQDEVVAHPLRRLTCTVRKLDRMTHDIVRLRLSIEAGGPFDFTAGQYAQVSFDGLPPREYSMANRPGNELLEFHIRQIPDGAVSAFANTKLKVGDTVRVNGPHGISYYRAKHNGPIVALAGGSGLAPIKSIVEEALAQGARQPIQLYFGVRDERDLYLIDYFSAMAATHPNMFFTPVLSEPSVSTPHRTGYLADVVAADFADLDGSKVYLAGPPIMVETCVERVRERGTGSEDCHADAFYTQADKAKLEATS